jgi:hypothetical protein
VQLIAVAPPLPIQVTGKIVKVFVDYLFQSTGFTPNGLTGLTYEQYFSKSSWS